MQAYTSPDVSQKSKGAPDEDLIRATLDGLKTLGRAGISARKISAQAGLSTSLINYHFQNFERLLGASFERALAHTDTWCAQQRRLLATLPPLPADAAGHLLASLIQDATANLRTEVFAWFECQLMAARDDTYAGVARRWRDVWRGLWGDLARAAGMPEAADITHPFVDSELCLHRIAWRPTLDQAILSETCVAWLHLLSHGRSPATPLRDHARITAQADTGPTPTSDSPAAAIASAAARLLGEEGPAAVTHRAVAREAGVNLGSVTYHFPTADALMHAAFEHIYLEIIKTSDVGEPRAPRPEEARHFIDGLAGYFSDPARRGPMLAIEELISAAARDPQLSGFGGTLRYTRGRSTLDSLRPLTSPLGAFSPSDAALLSGWMQGMGRDIRLAPPADQADAVRRAATVMLGRMQAL